jgi:hypothetical protein
LLKLEIEDYLRYSSQLTKPDNQNANRVCFRLGASDSVNVKSVFKDETTTLSLISLVEELLKLNADIN